MKLKKIRICILGAEGQVGREFQHIAATFEYINFVFYSKKDVDITHFESLERSIGQNQFDYVINCAAYTAVDKAEDEVEKCHAINALACINLIQALQGTKTKLVHFSSDYIYHTYSGFPLREEDETSPQGVYAKSKLEGELILRKSNVPCLILRTSWVISSFGHNFLKTMIRLGHEKPQITVVNDQYGAPTYARHLANVVLDIITMVHNDDTSGASFNDTYNFSNEGIVTWFDLAQRIMLESGLNCTVLPVMTKDYPSKAVRPNWSVLSKDKIKQKFGVEIQHWYVAIKECLAAISASQSQE